MQERKKERQEKKKRGGANFPAKERESDDALTPVDSRTPIPRTSRESERERE